MKNKGGYERNKKLRTYSRVPTTPLLQKLHEKHTPHKIRSLTPWHHTYCYKLFSHIIMCLYICTYYVFHIFRCTAPHQFMLAWSDDCSTIHAEIHNCQRQHSHNSQRLIHCVHIHHFSLKIIVIPPEKLTACASCMCNLESSFKSLLARWLGGVVKACCTLPSFSEFIHKWRVRNYMLINHRRKGPLVVCKMI